MATKTEKTPGEVLREAVLAAIPNGWELDERDQANLTLACRQLDDLERLEDAIGEIGTMTTGSTGQPVVNPAIAEARQSRIALSRLLGNVQIPAEEGGGDTSASQRAREAAHTRWGRKAQGSRG